MEIEKRKLRADEQEPPTTISVDDSHTLMDPAEYSRLSPYRRDKNSGLNDSAGSLQFVNHTSTKVIVILEGIPVAWVDAYSEGLFSGFHPGRYRIGAVRPFGGQLFSPKTVDLPGTFAIGRPTESTTTAAEKF
jgi:hypothetical protein